jgi:hypothetical protein
LLDKDDYSIMFKFNSLPRFLFVLLICSTVLLAVAPQVFAQAALKLADNGKSDYVIALADDAIPAEQTAAGQLQKFFQQVTGVRLEIKPEAQVAATAPQIVVGSGARAKALLPQVKWGQLETDTIILKTVGNKVVLAGDRPRGALYSVFEFLETQVGCRWWTATESTIPKRNVLTVGSLDVQYAPPFAYRSHYTTDITSNPFFAVVMRENGTVTTTTLEWGGKYKIIGAVHTHEHLVPPSKFFKDHPEWYSDPANGDKPSTANTKMPGANGFQLCLSNPALVEEITRQAVNWIDTNPDNYSRDSKGYISISENDNGHYCKCDDCVALRNAEGTQQGPNLKFVNEVAAGIKESYPNFLVETLAYRGTVDLPKTIRPADNVIIRFAPLQADYGHPLNSAWNGDMPGVTENVRDLIPRWAAVSHQLFVWNYVTNFINVLAPYPNWEGYTNDLRFFAANKVKGVFQQGDNYSNNVGDFVQMRAWVTGKLLWNPQLDQDALMNEFLNGYYGEAGPHLKQYIDTVQRAFLASNMRLSTHHADFSFLTLDVMNDMTRLFDQAGQAVKGDAVLADRVKRARLTLDVAWLYRYKGLYQQAQFQKKTFLGPADAAKAAADYEKAALGYGVKEYMEAEPFPIEMARLKQMFVKPAPLPQHIVDSIPAGSEAANVIDLQQNDLRLLRPVTWTGMVDDPAASDGKAATIVGNNSEWAINFLMNNYGAEFLAQDKWHIYVYARIDAINGDAQGNAINTGFYDLELYKKTQVSGVVSQATKTAAEMADGKYHEIDLGAHPLSATASFWFAPQNNPQINKVYLDRVILVRQ